MVNLRFIHISIFTISQVISKQKIVDSSSEVHANEAWKPRKYLINNDIPKFVVIAHI